MRWQELRLLAETRNAATTDALSGQRWMLFAEWWPLTLTEWHRRASWHWTCCSLMVICHSYSDRSIHCVHLDSDCTASCWCTRLCHHAYKLFCYNILYYCNIGVISFCQWTMYTSSVFLSYDAGKSTCGRQRCYC